MNRLLLVGWDAADWKVIDPLLARGEMPVLASIIKNGVRGNIATINPPLSPMVWTSIATGKRPPKHGILGFTEPTPDGSSIRPITILGRKTKAVWNILNQNGKRSIVAGWWPSHPAEPIRGAMVSNHFPFPHDSAPESPLPSDTISPASLTDELSDLRVHFTELTGEIIRMFVPDYDRIDQSKDRTLHDLARIIAETMSIHSVATELIETQPWDFAAVYFTGIDHFSHRFMRYHARKRMPKSGTPPEIYRDIVVNAYRYHDLMLGRLIRLAGPDCAVMVLSDHGFHSDRMLPDYIPADGAGPAVEHREFGVFCLRGPGIRRGETIYGASVLDIAPTVLQLFGIPAAADMDGRVLANAFEQPAIPTPVPSWDDIEGDDGRHPADMQYDGAASAEALKQLVALGYISPPGPDAQRSVDRCVRELRYNLAVAQIDAGQIPDAVSILRELIAVDIADLRFQQHLFHCLLNLGDVDGAARVLADFDAQCEEFGPRAAEELQRRRSEKSDRRLSRDGKDARREMHERQELAEKATAFVQPRLLMHARLAISQASTPEDREKARSLLEQIAADPRAVRSLALFLAEGFAVIGDGSRALDYIRRAKRGDPENWHALSLEARVHHGMGAYKAALNSCIESLSLVYYQPLIHYLMGLCLRHLGDDERAAASFRIALAQRPQMAPAHDQMAAVLRQGPQSIGEAALHMARADQIRKKRHRARTVTIVTGLPRSGTSMMMQMLAAGGIQPYTDSQRLPDADNPRGYFEHELATRLHQDRSWLPHARGKAVKIIAQLIPHLPPDQQFRIVFMHRNLEEVVASQSAMLRRLGHDGANLSEAELIAAYRRDLLNIQTWLNQHPQISVLPVHYSEAVADPQATAKKLAAFFGKPFDTAAAAAAVAPELRRQIVT